MTAAYGDEPTARVGINRILEKVTSIETTLAVAVSDMKTQHATTTASLKDLDTRVDALESTRFPWKVIGGIVAVGALLLALVTFVEGRDPAPPPAYTPPHKSMEAKR